jgi:hypothetical protein
MAEPCPAIATAEASRSTAPHRKGVVIGGDRIDGRVLSKIISV